MQVQQCATRPQIAAALGLSLVSTNAAVAALEKEGVLQAGRLIPSGGGRPVREYHFNASHAAVALFSATPEAHCTLIHFELLDLQGKLIEKTEARFVQLHAESLDEWLDGAARRHKIQRICLPPGLGSNILPHLQHRHHTSHVQEYYAVESLAPNQESTLTLLLRQGQPPQGVMRRNGRSTPCTLLHLLPLPAEWETLNYADHTLVEEMVARLLQVLTCVLTPAQIKLYADFWNDRLISRLNFNLGTKLRGIETPPHLHFATINSDILAQKVRKSIARYIP